MNSCAYSPPQPPVDQPVAVAVDAARVTVVDKGQGPHRVLTFADIGQKQQSHFSLTEGFSQDVVQAQRAQEFQPNNLNKDTISFDIAGEVDHASEDPAQAPATRNVFMTVSNPEFSFAPAETASGFQWGWRATDNGKISSLRFAAPKEADDTSRSAIERAIAPITNLPIIFPSEEIGQGAVWTVESKTAGDNSLLQKSTFTLEDLTEETAELSVTVDQRPTLGALAFVDANSNEQQLDVLSAESRTTAGTLTVDFAQPLPTSGTVEVSTRVMYGQADSSFQVIQTTSSRISFASK